MILMWFILVCAVVFDAIGDALMFLGKKTLSKLFQMLMILMFGVSIIVSNYLPQGYFTWPQWAYLVLMYGFIRGGLMNPLWGHLAVKKWYALGRTSYTDRILLWITNIKWINGKIIFVRKPFLIVVYVFSFLLSVGILFQKFLS